MSKWRIKQAVKALQQGGVIAYPTEAVYGLGCDPWNKQAVGQLLEIKQRPWQKGLILIAADFNQLQHFIEPVTAEILTQLESTWPGSTTWLLPVRSAIPDYLTGEHDSIAVRVTAHKQTAELCRSFGGAIISTSANVANMRPAKSIRQVRGQLSNIDYVLSGQCSGSDKPSDIRNAVTGEQIR